MEQVLNKLKSEIDTHPSDDWDRGWNAAIRLAIRELEAAKQCVQSDLLPCGHPKSSWKLGGCGEGCIECANAATSR